MAWTNITQIPRAGFAAASSRWDSVEDAQPVRCEGDGGVYHAYQLPDGTIVGEALVAPSTEKEAELAAESAAASSARAAESTRAQAIANALAKLDARTATNAETQAYLAALIRFVGAHVARR